MLRTGFHYLPLMQTGGTEQTEQKTVRGLVSQQLTKAILFTFCLEGDHRKTFLEYLGKMLEGFIGTLGCNDS